MYIWILVFLSVLISDVLFNPCFCPLWCGLSLSSLASLQSDKSCTYHSWPLLQSVGPKPIVCRVRVFLLAFLAEKMPPFLSRRNFAPFIPHCSSRLLASSGKDKLSSFSSGLAALTAQLTAVIIVQLLFRCQGCFACPLVSSLIPGASYFAALGIFFGLAAQIARVTHVTLSGVLTLGR